MSMLKTYRAEKARLRSALGGVAAISFLASMCLLSMPIYLSQVYNRVIYSHSIETLISLTVIALVMLATFAALDAIRAIMLGRLATQFEARMSGMIIAGELLRSNDTQRATGAYLNAISRVLGSHVITAIFDLPAAVLFLFVVYFVHPLLGAVVTVGIVVLLAIAIVGELITSRHAKLAQASSTQASRRLDVAYRQNELIKAMGMFREVVRDWGEVQADSTTHNLAATERSAIVSSISKTARQIVQIVLIGTGALLVMDNLVAGGTIFAASLIGGRALSPIEAIVGGWRNLKTASISDKLLEQRLHQLDLPDALTPLPRPEGKIGIEGVTYASPTGREPILKNVSGQIPAGGSVAIIGPSGAGKSTLARCIVGFYAPSRGRVTLDGQDVQNWDPVVRGLYVGYLPQVVDFFEGTVAQNIARMRVGDPAEAVIDAAQLAGVHSLIMSFPEGYDTMITQGGFQPSGGQRQLLGLARAFYGGPAVVVLDEPNANLDGDGEKILGQAMMRAKQAKTTMIVVTQRLSLLQFVDKVLVMKNGSVEQFVEPSEIQKTNVRSLGKPAQNAERIAQGDR
jgi:PrtD family type I secretion system ABC transporter